MADKPKYNFDAYDDTLKKYDFSAFGAPPEDINKPSEYSTLGAAAMGAAKGATFGFDDEIAGVAKALIDKGIGSKKNFWDIYKEVRDNVRTEHAAAEEQHPVASFAGEMAGGILPMVAAPEALIGKGAAAGASWLQRAKALGTTGAKVGALAGLGGSTADLTKGEVGQAAADTAGGAVSGAVIGGVAMPAITDAAGAAGKGAWNIAKQFPIIGENVETFKRAASGMDLLGKQTETTQATNKLAQNTIADLETLRSASGDARQLAINAASDSGITVDPHAWADKWLAEADAKLSGASKEQVQDIMDFKNKIKSMVQETTKEVTSFIPTEQPAPAAAQSPQDVAMGKVQSTMTKKVLADKTQADLLEKKLGQMVQSGEIDPSDDAAIQRIQSMLKKIETLRSGNEFAPEIVGEAGTEMEGIVAPRGADKTPVVEAIMPPKAVKETPFDAMAAKVTSEVTERGVDRLSPTEISKFATDLNQNYRAIAEDPTKYMSRDLFGGAKKDLQKMIEDAARLSPDAKSEAVTAFNKALEGYQEETGKFIGVAKTQETLGQPGFSAVGEGQGKVLQLQNMIQNYNKPGSNARLILDQALDRLSAAYPEEAAAMKALIQDASKNRDIAMGLSAQSPLATNMLHASAKAVAMNISRLTGMAYGTLAKAGSGMANNASDALVATGNAIYGASPEMIQGMADRASKMGGAFGNMITKTLGAITEAPQNKQRAVLFTLMQQPDFRKFAQEYMSQGDAK